MGKKTHASKSKLKNKHQSKKNSSRNVKGRKQNKSKNQGVTIQKQSFSDVGGADENHQVEDIDAGILGPDASLEDIDYLLSNRRNISFLSQELESDEPPNKRKKKSDNEESTYEKLPRKLGKAYLEDVTSDRIHLLPVKGKDGLVQRSVAKSKEDEEQNKENVEESNHSDDLHDNFKKEFTLVEIYAEREKSINHNKAAIAAACEEILQDPEGNLKSLKRLLDLCSKDQIVVIRKLSMVSLCEVFKDIVPGYRIRPLTDAEKSGKVSKEVKKLREFEEGLVTNYKKYIDVLEEAVQDFVSKKKKETNHSMAEKVAKGVAVTAVKCMVDVLAVLSHFNYRTNLIVAVVSKVNYGGEKAEISDICIGALKNLFRNDEFGDISLEAMKVISRIAKSGLGKIRPQVLETLLYLNIDAQMIKDAESRESKIERLRKRKEVLKKMSKKEKKRKKLESKLDKELQETQAVESRQKIQKFQTEILKFVFIIYFRVLKLETKTPLLTPVLKGLSKYAYLINVDFFSDLMTALNRLISSGELSLTESLNGVLTAFKILSGQGESLNIDPHNFYLHLYNSLVDVSGDSKHDDIDLCIECLSLMLVKRRKQVSIRRIQGFLKRIATISLHHETEELFSLLSLLRSVLQLNQKCDALLDNEQLGRGVFQPELTDPEHCNADSTALWELSFLTKHFYSDVHQYAKHMLHGAPSQGQHSLPASLSQRKEVEDPKNPPMEYFFPSNIPSKRQSKKNQKLDDKFFSNSFKDLVSNTSDIKNCDSYNFAKFIR